MPWCHTCRVEYAFELDACPECGGRLTDAPAPERRAAVAMGGSQLVVLATLPPEQALVASGRLDADGIENALRDVGAGLTGPLAVEVLVPPWQVPEARAVLRGRRRGRRSTLGLYLFIVAAACVFLSGALLAVRWLTTGSPLGR